MHLCAALQLYEMRSECIGTSPDALDINLIELMVLSTGVVNNLLLTMQVPPIKFNVREKKTSRGHAS